MNPVRNSRFSLLRNATSLLKYAILINLFS